MDDNKRPFNVPTNPSTDPIDWSKAEPLPPVSDAITTTPTLCTEGKDILSNSEMRSYETFTKHDNDN